MTTRWVLFDYGHVLTTEQPETDVRRLLEASGVPDRDRFAQAYWAHRPGYDTGAVSDAQYWSAVAGHPLPDETAAELAGLDTASWLHLRPYVLDVVARTQASGARVALLSNAPAALADAVDAQPWAGCFERRFFSCRFGAVKPDERLYQAVLRELGADPDDVILLDDRPANVEGAVALGMLALQVDVDDPFPAFDRLAHLLAS